MVIYGGVYGEESSIWLSVCPRPEDAIAGAAHGQAADQLEAWFRPAKA